MSGGNINLGQQAAAVTGLVTGANDLTKIAGMTTSEQAVTLVNATQSVTAAADQLEGDQTNKKPASQGNCVEEGQTHCN
ncbi:MAG: hypothetical protein WCD49_08945 [Candidatus Acidiferrales bacterium]